MPDQPSLDFEALQRALPGQVSRDGDARYVDAVSLWNGSITQRPAAVAHCRDARDVARAITFAREAGAELSVRGGGHNFAGTALCEGGLTIDLSPQREVRVDPRLRRARCGGGTRWSELDAACQQHGLAVTGGMISHTGVGGLTLGGGVGWLHSRVGLSCDNLVSAELVTASGRILRASESEHPELFWALRGGGGNFGVVTEFEFQLSPLGPLVQVGLFFFGLEQGALLLRFVNAFTRTLDGDSGVFVAGLNAPPAPFVPEREQGKACYVLAIAGYAGEQAHARQCEVVRAAVRPSFELVAPMPYVELQKLFDASAPWGTLAYEKAVYLEELSAGAIDVITTQLPKKSSPQSFLPMLVLGGAYARAREDAVAFGGKRSTRFIVNCTALTTDPAQFEAEKAWARSFWSELVPYAQGVAGYVNYQVEADEARVRASYGSDKYARLSRIKTEYDPDNVFHRNANIRPG
jgi:FAD/FMN-containing dehydrogenase